MTVPISPYFPLALPLPKALARIALVPVEMPEESAMMMKKTGKESESAASASVER